VISKIYQGSCHFKQSSSYQFLTEIIIAKD